MKNESPDDLLKKYLEGQSTLEEEQRLLNKTELGQELSSWSTYVSDSRMAIPEKLNANIGAAINRQKRKRQGYLYSVLSVAATIVILVISGVLSSGDAEMNYAEKEAKLNEALAMFSQEEEIDKKKTVFYEDDIVIIFAESE